MKTTLITAVAALVFGAPAFAAQVTDARAHFAQSEEGSDRIVNAAASGNARTAMVAYAHFADAEDDDTSTPGMLVVSSSNADLAAFAKAKLSTGDRSDQR